MCNRINIQINRTGVRRLVHLLLTLFNIHGNRPNEQSCIRAPVTHAYFCKTGDPASTSPISSANRQCLPLKHHGMDLLEQDAFIKENEAWEDLIRRQRLELSHLSTGMNQFLINRRQAEDDYVARVTGFRFALQQLEAKMLKVEHAISLQLQFLSHRSNGSRADFPARSLRRQERLRNLIRCVEQGLFALKSEWMAYLWSVH